MEPPSPRESHRSDTDTSRIAQGTGQEKNQVWIVLFPEDLLPGVPFTVLWELDWILTARLLRGPEGLLIPNRRDYDSYVVEFDYSSTPQYAIVFVPMNQGVQRGQQYVLGGDAHFLLDARGLLLSTARRIPSGPVFDTASVRVDPGSESNATTETPTETPTEES